MGKKLSHLETWHRMTNYRHIGDGHSIKIKPTDVRDSWTGSRWAGVQIDCVCGQSGFVSNTNLADDPGACTTCGTALKRFEMFTTSYERCYTCEPLQGSRVNHVKTITKNRCWGFWYANEPIGYNYRNEWCGYHSRADIPEEDIHEFRKDGQRLYCLEWDGEIDILRSGYADERFYFRFNNTTPGIVVEKLEASEY